MQRKIQNIILILVVFLIGNACTKRIEIPLKKGNERLVVEGYLFDSDSISWVKLTKSTGYFSNTPPEGIPNADVTVSCGSKTWKLQPSKNITGLYLLQDSSFHLIVYDTFLLHIQLQKPVGQYSTYESSTTVPALRAHIDSLGIEFSPDFKKWLIRYYGQDIPGHDYYLFNSAVNNHIVSDSILQKTIRKDEYFDGRYISGAVVQILNEKLLHTGDLYSLLVSNITADYYTYLNALQNEVDEQNPLFSGPPSNATGNINHNALGYFTAFYTTSYSVQLIQIQTDPPHNDYQQ